MCELTRIIDVVTYLVEQTLLSNRNFSDAKYISVYDENEVNIYDALTTKIIVPEKAVLKGWRCPTTPKLW